MIPLVKRALPRGAAAVRGRLRRPRRGAAAARRRRRAAPARARRSAARRRWPLLSLAPALFALRGGELAAYHGVEHKAIAAYEQDADDAARRRQGARPLRLAPRRAAARLQPGGHAARCAAWSRSRAPLAGAAVALASTASRSRCSRGASATPTRRSRGPCAGPGFELQRLIGTREPDERQLEVGRAALAEILRVEGSSRSAQARSAGGFRCAADTPDVGAASTLFGQRRRLGGTPAVTRGRCRPA